jgi:hypothetical protein
VKIIDTAGADARASVAEIVRRPLGEAADEVFGSGPEGRQLTVRQGIPADCLMRA